MSLDCLIIGGGPAGLTAALYLARFERRFLVVDAGAPRAASIPVSHNIPFYPHGIAGPEIIARQQSHLRRYGDDLIRAGEVVSLARKSGGFVAQVLDGNGLETIKARRVLLATGACDVEPDLPDVEGVVRRGLVRYCPICDGYEARGRKIGVIGHGTRGLGEAVFIARTYGADVTVLTLGRELHVSEADQKRADRFGVKLVCDPVTALQVDGERIGAVLLAGHGELKFDVLYSALGLEMRSGLGLSLGAAHDECGALTVDAHQHTSVPGLYAAGGVVQGLDQVVVAMGHAAVAATHIHNHCDETFDEH